MKAMIFMFLLVTGVAQAGILDVKCMKKAKKLGLSMTDSYQTCKGLPAVKACVFVKQAENKKIAADKKELKAMSKQVIKDCNK